MRRTALWLMAAILCASLAASAENVVSVGAEQVGDAPIALLEPVATKEPASLEALIALPKSHASVDTDADGYAVQGEYVRENAAEGEYVYLSQTLQVHVTRHTDTSPKVVWHAADIRSRDGTLFGVYPYDATDTVRKTAFQPLVAQVNHLVFAVNGDFSHLRRGWNARVGIEIRDGEVISSETFKASTTKYPNLDNLAFLPDGSMLAADRNAYTAEEYLAMGAYDVLAFGPVLVHEGEINYDAFKRYGWERAPRTAIGMIEAGHYACIMVEGRHDDSKGWSTTHLAEHMAELGCTEALNLDGGQSATMVFMGKQIIRVGQSTSDTANARKAAEVVGIGVTELVQPSAETK